MASTYSSILRTELIGSGDQAGAWGSTTNSNFQYIFEAAIAGYVAVTVSPSSNNQVLTYVNGPSASAALDQAVYAMLKLNTGSLSANFNIFAPPVSKTFIVWNNTSYTATFYNSTVIGNTTAAGSGITVPAGAKVWIWSDGTNFWGNDTVAGNLTVSGNLAVSGTTTLTTPLSAANGGTGLTSLGTGVATFLGSPTSANLSAAVTDETGTGTLVFSASPAFTGTPLAPTAAAGTNTTQIATTAFVAQNAVLTGALIMWATASAPSGYLLCDGTAVSRTTYAALYAVVGTTFGVGDGSTTFNVPNYQGRSPLGSSGSYALASTGGSADAVVVSHTHTATVTDPGHKHQYIQNYGTDTTTVFATQQTYTGALKDTTTATTGISVANSTTGVSGTGANLQPYLAINFIIKT